MMHACLKEWAGALTRSVSTWSFTIYLLYMLQMKNVPSVYEMELTLIYI
jgi:hypothetical protein